MQHKLILSLKKKKLTLTELKALSFLLHQLQAQMLTAHCTRLALSFISCIELPLVNLKKCFSTVGEDYFQPPALRHSQDNRADYLNTFQPTFTLKSVGTAV